MQDYVSGKVVVITGGTSGFGLASARLLLERDARVVITGRNPERLAAARDQLANPHLLAIRADAVSTSDWQTVVRQTVEQFARIDVLVNNHGAGVKIATVEEMTDADLQTILDINLTSVMKGCREVIPAMKRQGSGQIINVSSGCAYHSWPKWAIYTAAKEGLVGFTRCLHLEMSAWGGKATSFIPGAARTSFAAAAGLDDDWLDGFPDADDFARTLVHCIDVPENSFIEEVNIWGTRQVKEMVVPF